MPEGPEFESEALKETIDKEIEKHEEPILRAIALATALLATFAAIASLQAGGTVNESLALKTDATRLQAQASDQWTYYQAKGIKAAVARGTAAAFQASGKPVPAGVDSVVARETREQKAVQDSARALERRRDQSPTTPAKAAIPRADSSPRKPAPVSPMPRLQRSPGPLPWRTGQKAPGLRMRRPDHPPDPLVHRVDEPATPDHPAPRPPGPPFRGCDALAPVPRERLPHRCSYGCQAVVGAGWVGFLGCRT